MADDVQNPRKLQTACRIFRAGAIGHTFSRPLTKAESARLADIIRSNGHGSCIFNNAETGLAIGAWLCTCEQECQPQLIMFAGDLRISIIAQVAGEPSYVMTGDDTWQIQIQQIGAGDQARALQVASVASQTATQVAAEVATKVTATLSKEIAQKTVAGVLENAGHFSGSEEAELKLVWGAEKVQ